MLQVSNWFINARVRLWKPMVEEMYQQELKEAEVAQEREEEEDEEGEEEDEEEERNQSNNTNNNNNSSNNNNNLAAQTPTTASTATTVLTPTTTTTSGNKRSHIINASESDPSLVAINTPPHPFSESDFPAASEAAPPPFDDSCRHRGSLINTADYGTTNLDHHHNHNIGSTLIRFGTTAGDVSLTLGLRHAGNIPDKAPFSVRDFGGI